MERAKLGKHGWKQMTRMPWACLFTAQRAPCEIRSAETRYCPALESVCAQRLMITVAAGLSRQFTWGLVIATLTRNGSSRALRAAEACLRQAAFIKPAGTWLDGKRSKFWSTTTENTQET